MKALQQFLKNQVESIEKEMTQTIKTDEKMNVHYPLLLSVNGIGMINAIYKIIATHNLKMCYNAKQYASYIRVAPFEHTSSISVK